MPFGFEFHIAKLFTHCELTMHEELSVSNEYGIALIEISKAFFPKLKVLNGFSDGDILLKYFQKIIIEYLNKQGESLASIQAEYKHILKPKTNIQALIEVLLFTYKKVVEIDSKLCYDTQEDQIAYLRRVQQRTCIMGPIFCMLNNDFHLMAEFQKSRNNFLLALFEDMDVLLFNIAYGLYYRKYTLDFETFKYTFEITKKTYNSFLEQVKKEMRQTNQISYLLPIFESAFKMPIYSAAFYFSLGHDILAQDALKVQKAQSQYFRDIFCAMQPSQENYYQTLLEEQKQNKEGFDIDSPFNQSRKLYARLLGAIRVKDEDLLTVPQSSNDMEKELAFCVAQLSKFKKINESSSAAFIQSLFALRKVCLKQVIALPYVKLMNTLIKNLSILLDKEPPNIMLAELQDFLTGCKDNVAIKEESQKSIENPVTLPLRPAIDEVEIKGEQKISQPKIEKKPKKSDKKLKKEATTLTKQSQEKLQKVQEALILTR